MGWLHLGLAILFEVSGTLSMKLSKGFTDHRFTPWIFVFYGVSFFFLTYAIRLIELSVAYAVWSGVGTTLIALIGIVAFRESVSPLKIISIALVIAGVIGLELSGGEIAPR